MICSRSAPADLSRALLMEYRNTMDHLAPSTINVRMSAIRKLVGEARRNGMIGLEEAANLTYIPTVRQKGIRLGNWLTREQAKDYVVALSFEFRAIGYGQKLPAQLGACPAEA